MSSTGYTPSGKETDVGVFDYIIGLEGVDTGMIVYPSWRVANGALPYRYQLHVHSSHLHELRGRLELQLRPHPRRTAGHRE